MGVFEYIARRVAFRSLLAVAHLVFIIGRAMSWTGRKIMICAARLVDLWPSP